MKNMYAGKDLVKMIMIKNHARDLEGNVLVTDGKGGELFVPAEEAPYISFIEGMCLVTDGIVWATLSSTVFNALFKTVNSTNNLWLRTFIFDGAIVLVQADFATVDSNEPRISIMNMDTKADMKSLFVSYPVPLDWEGTSREYVNYVMQNLTANDIYAIYFQ